MDLGRMYDRLTAVNFDGARLGQSGQTLSNIQAFKGVVEQVADLPPLVELAAQLRASRIWPIGANQIGFDLNEANSVKELADNFYFSALGLRNALSKVVGKLRPESIVVKLPEQESRLESVINRLGWAGAAFGCAHLSR